ncbi:MAG: hypothetical protein AB1758_07360 [Candidatus Eremiobacterota bacterium]
MNKRAGVGLPTVLLFVLLMFFLATVLVTQANYDLRYAGVQAERTHALFLARAIVNEALSNLNKDPGWESYTRDAPYRARWDSFDVETWCEQDPDHPGVMYLYGRATPLGGGAPQEFMRTVTRRPDVAGTAFALAPQFDLNRTNSFFMASTSQTDWQLLPPATQQYYRSDGTLATVPGKYCTSLSFSVADQRGNLYAKYDPWVDSGGLVVKLVLKSLKQGMEKGEKDGLFNVVDIAEANIKARKGGDVNSGLLLRYSVSDQDWKALPPFPGLYYKNDGSQASLGEMGAPGMVGHLSTDGERYLYASCWLEGPDFVYRFDMDSQQWDTLPPGPNLRYAADGSIQGSGLASQMYDTAVGGDGTLYTHCGSSKTEQVLVQFDPAANAWKPLPAIPRQLYDRAGQLVANPEPLVIGDITASQDGLYAVSVAGDTGVDTVFRYSGGSWTPIKPPTEASYQSDGTLVEGSQLSAMIDVISADGEGNLLVKSPYPGQADTIYRYAPSRDDYEVLPPLPNQLYDVNGNRLDSTGYFDLTGGIMGGASESGGQTHYEPVASF